MSSVPTDAPSGKYSSIHRFTMDFEGDLPRCRDIEIAEYHGFKRETNIRQLSKSTRQD